MPTIEEQKALIRKMLASQPDSWIAVGALMLSHSSLPQVFCFTDYYGGFTKNDHDGYSRDWLYAPLKFDIPSVTGDMDAEFKLTVSDLNEDGTTIGINDSIRTLTDLIPENTQELPKLTVLAYISYPDGTFSDYCDGPYEFEVVNVQFQQEGAVITAKSPDALFASCGETYTVQRFKMLKQYT